MKSSQGSLVLASLLALAACGEDTTSESGALTHRTGHGEPAPTSSAVRFIFLPPTVDVAAPFEGDFDGTRYPMIRITCAAEVGAICGVDETLRREKGPEGIKVDAEEEHYRAKWHSTRNLELGGGRYRMIVSDQGVTLAEAALWVVDKRKQERSVPPGPLVVVRGKPFEIRFRMETTVGSIGTVELFPAAVTLTPGEKLIVAATQKDAGGQIVSGISFAWSSSVPAVATVAPDGTVEAVGLGSAEISASNGTATGKAVVKVVPVPATASASLGKAGGSLSAPLADGGHLDVVVPPDAVTEPTTFMVEPTRRVPGANASFLFSPSGQPFGAPVKFAYTPASGELPLGPLYLVSARSITPLIPDGPTGRYAGSTRLVGTLPTFAPAGISPAGLSARLLARAQAPGQPVSVGSLTTAEIVAAGRTVLDAHITAPTLATATALMTTMPAVVGVRFQTDFAPAGDQLLTDWRATVCNRLRDQVNHVLALSVGAPFDFNDFFAEGELLFSWAAPAEQTQDPNLDLPFTGCDGGMPDYVAALTGRAEAFIQRIPELINPPDRDLLVRFDEMIDTHIVHLTVLDGQLQFVGVTAFRPALRQIGAAVLNKLRGVAWAACHDRTDQSRIARLLDLEVTVGEELSTYTQADLTDDVNGCTTQLQWRVRPHAAAGNGLPESEGTLGGSGVGQPANAASITLREDRDLVLGGLVQLLICPGDLRLGVPPQENVEQLVLRAESRTHQAVMATRTVGLGGPRVYLHQDSILISPAALSAALGVSDEVPLELSVQRVGNTCTTSFGALGGELRLATITLTIARTKVTLNPTSADLTPGGTVSFEATVANSDNGVTWEITGGSQVVSGNTLTYTAGNIPGGFTVVAKSVDLPERTATAAITIADQCVAPGPSGLRAIRISSNAAACVAVNVVPAATTMNLGTSRQFTATVSGSTNAGVTWTATSGAMSGSGVFTPSTFGSVTITASSVADPTQSAVAVVTVVPTGGIVVSPSRAAVGFSRSQQFQVVQGTGPFSWTTDGGTVSSTGLFKSGTIAGEFSVVAAGSTGGAGVATVIVDPFLGNYRGSYTRFLPFPQLVGTNAQFSINRILSPQTGCTASRPCYHSGQFDIGTVVLGECWFQPDPLEPQKVSGFCDPGASSSGGVLQGQIANDVYTWTLQRTGVSGLSESWAFATNRLIPVP